MIFKKRKNSEDRKIKKNNYRNLIRFFKNKLRISKQLFWRAKKRKHQIIFDFKKQKRNEINDQKKVIRELKNKYQTEKRKYKKLKQSELQKNRNERNVTQIIQFFNDICEIKKQIKQNKLALLKLYDEQKNLFNDWTEMILINQIKDEIKKNKLLLRDCNLSITSYKNDFNFQNNCFEIKDLNFWYHKKQIQVLRNININIKEKKVTALIGPSGCGKSTFLKCLNRMHDFTQNVNIEGNIWFKGKNIFSKILPPLELRAQVGMVFQRPTPFPMSIFENVAYSLKCHGLYDRSTVDRLVKEALMDVALWDEVKDNLSLPASTLSGGQQQRLCIARAVVIKPVVLLMDEPTSALDPIAVAKIEQLIVKLKKNYTIIIVTHSMAQAQRISDETIFFYQGQIVESGSTRGFFVNPKNKQTKDYISGKIG